MTQPVVPAYLTPEEVAGMLRFDSVKSVYRLAKSEPTLPVWRTGAGKNAHILFPRERLLKWLRDREQGRAHPMRQQVLSHSNPAPNGAAADA
jgi:Helix-turn-helix domain